jgi:hypothetical protein
VEAREADVDLGRKDEVDAAGKGERGLAAAQALRGEVDGDERGGAGRVERHAGALEAEDIREPACRGAGGVAGQRVRADAGEVAGAHLLGGIVGAAEAEKDAGGGPL